MKYSVKLITCILLCTTYVMAVKGSTDTNRTLNIPLIPTSHIITQTKISPSVKKKVKKRVSNLDILEQTDPDTKLISFTDKNRTINRVPKNLSILDEVDSEDSMQKPKSSKYQKEKINRVPRNLSILEEDDTELSTEKKVISDDSKRSVNSVPNNLSILEQDDSEIMVQKSKSTDSKKKKINKIPVNLKILEENSDTPKVSKVIKPVPKTALELEDERYMKVRSADINDSRLPTLTLDMAQKHIDAKEYLIAEFYVQLYIRDYEFGEALDRAWYIRIHSLFRQFIKSQAQEGLFRKIALSSRYFAENFLESKYREEVASMFKKSMKIAKQRNEEIAAYYDKIGKKKAATYYRNKNKQFEMGGY